jgi:hypothetical protein
MKRVALFFNLFVVSACGISSRDDSKKDGSQDSCFLDAPIDVGDWDLEVGKKERLTLRNVKFDRSSFLSFGEKLDDSNYRFEIDLYNPEYNGIYMNGLGASLDMEEISTGETHWTGQGIVQTYRVGMDHSFSLSYKEVNGRSISSTLIEDNRLKGQDRIDYVLKGGKLSYLKFYIQRDNGPGSPYEPLCVRAGEI